MRKLILAVLAFACLIAGFAAPSATASAQQRATTVCDPLADGAGQGSAASPKPQETPYAGEPTQQIDVSSAWAVCFTGLDWSQLPLKSASSLCLVPDSAGTVKLQKCSNNHDNSYWRETGAGPGFHLQNRATKRYLCAAGGIGSGDVVVSLKNCSNNYHDTWKFVSPSSARATAAMSLAGHWTPQRLRDALRDKGPFLICAENHPVGKLAMGMWYALQETNVLAEPCDASREWKLVDKGNDPNGVPQVEILAVGDGNWLAASDGCTFVIRKFDDTQSGTVWKLFVAQGHLYIASRRCSGVDSKGNIRYNKDAATNNRLDNRWFIADRNNPEPGDYIKVVLRIPPSMKTMHVTVLAAHRACAPHCVTEVFNQIPNGSEVGGHWTQNGPPVHYLRGHARCVNRAAGTAKNTNGGWVTSLNLNSFAFCKDPYAMVHGAYQVKNCSSCSIGTFWFWPPSARATIPIKQGHLRLAA